MRHCSRIHWRECMHVEDVLQHFTLGINHWKLELQQSFTRINYYKIRQTKYSSHITLSKSRLEAPSESLLYFGQYRYDSWGPFCGENVEQLKNYGVMILLVWFKPCLWILPQSFIESIESTRNSIFTFLLHNMMIIWTFCSQTICQKSTAVACSGSCVAM